MQMQSDSCHLSDAVREWLTLLENKNLEMHFDSIQRRFKQAMEPFHFLAYMTDPRYIGMLYIHFCGFFFIF